ncbi:MAG: hypothetical protein JJT94_12350 [Bernardetiaceae bacterium]|nr:hypothetical protein [Bernardetiaceae bacterium]
MLNYGIFILFYLIIQFVPADKDVVHISLETQGGEQFDFKIERSRQDDKKWILSREGENRQEEVWIDTELHLVEMEGNTVEINAILDTALSNISWKTPMKLKVRENNPDYPEPTIVLTQPRKSQLKIATKGKNEGIYFMIKKAFATW